VDLPTLGSPTIPMERAMTVPSNSADGGPLPGAAN